MTSLYTKMGFRNIQSILFLTQISLSATAIIDQVFHHFPWKGDILKDSWKPWIVYVDRALYRSVPKYHLYYKQQTSSLHLIHKRIKDIHFQWQNNCINFEYLKLDETVIEPAGNFQLEEWYYGYLGFGVAHTYHTWNFALSSELRLNFSFIYINIRKVYQSCLRGNFSIQMRFSNKSEVSTLCGKYSFFIHYTSTSMISLILVLYDDILFDIDLKFSIMTENVVLNKVPSKDMSPSILYIHVIPSLNISLTTFHLRVEKYQRICFNGSSAHQYTIIDGPSFKAPSIHLSTGNFCAATFQVIVQVENVLSYKFLQYTGINISFSKISIADRILYYENNNIDTYIAPLQFEVKYGFYLNLTLKSVYFSGESSHDCRYGGIRIYDDQHPLLDICENYSNENIVAPNNYSDYYNVEIPSRPSRNIYSSNLILVSYTYHPFTSLNFSISVSSILCEPVQLDFCKLLHFKDKWSSYQETFLKWLDNQSFTKKLQLEFQIYDFFYSVPLGKCIIIHSANDYLATDVTPDMVLTDAGQCSLKLLLKHTSETDRVFTFKTRYVEEFVSSGEHIIGEHIENDDTFQAPCSTGNERTGRSRRSGSQISSVLNEKQSELFTLF